MKFRFAAALLLITSAALAGEVSSYIYARGNHTTSKNVRLSSLTKLVDKHGGEFVWARVRGREYMIRDAATLAEVRKLFAPADALRPEYEALMRRMRPLERREAELEKQMEAYEDEDEEESAPDPALKAEYREVTRKLQALEREEERLDQQVDALEREAERGLEKVIERAIERGVAVRQ